MLSAVDLAIIGVFFAVLFGWALWERKDITLEDYWVNSRDTDKYIVVATILSTYVGVGSIFSNASFAYSGAGFATAAILLSFFLYFYLFGKFFAPKIKEFGDKHNAYTLPDFLEERFSSRVRIAGAFVNFIMYGLLLALQILGMATLLSAFSSVSPTIATLIGGAIIVLYTTIGGLRADIRTDIFQFIVMVFLLVVFLPLVISNAGGFSTITSLPTTFLTGGEYMPFYLYILMAIFLGASVLTASDLWQRVYAGDTKKNVEWAMKTGGIAIAVFFFMAMLFGIFAKAMLSGVDPNFVIPELIQSVLPAGVVGVVLAGLFAAVMSSADTMLLIASMTLVHDVYEEILGNELNSKSVLKISRWTTFVLGVLAVGVTLLLFNFVDLAINSLSFAVVLIPPIVFGFYWEQANEAAAFWSIVTGTVTLTGFSFVDPKQAFVPAIIVSFGTFWLVQKAPEYKRRYLQ